MTFNFTTGRKAHAKQRFYGATFSNYRVPVAFAQLLWLDVTQFVNSSVVGQNVNFA